MGKFDRGNPGRSPDLSEQSDATALLVTVIIAAVSGLVSGKVLAVMGRRSEPYIDSEEFEGEEGEEQEVRPCVAAAEQAA